MKKLFLLIFLAYCGAITEITTIQGIDGNNGINGQNGTSCTASSVLPSESAPNGGAIITCGDTSALILNGTNGLNGENGNDGANGHDGAPGSVITAIQFCTGTPHYPTTFPEIGFCINDKLYAVYSLYNGFLVEVLPGNYSSQGLGNSCSFSVQEHCVVNH